MAPTSGPRTTTTTEHAMKRVISGISSDRAREDPSACISALNPLMDTAEGRKFLSKQQGEKALVLIELFDWALKSHGVPKKGCILWTLRQLCAYQETLPKSCVLPIEFKSSDPHHAAGGFADVWKGNYNGREVAFKSIRGSTLSDDAARLKRKRRFCKEVILWKSLRHPNILGLIGVCQWENTPDARLTMVSVWMANGNITEYIRRNDSPRMELLIDCAEGLRYLHGSNLVHGDLKGANILVTSDTPVRACLADFGFMTIVYDDASGPETTTALGGGTTPFMAPELLSPSMFGKKRCQVSKEADAYAFGMVVLQVLTGLMPFHTLRDTEISYKVIQGDRPAMPTNASELGISDGLWQLLVRCWNVDYTKRPQINEILQRLSQEPDLGRIFPPLKPPPAPICDCESVFESGTQKYGEIFVTAPASADARVSSEECPPFPMPISPADTAEYSSHETRNSMSLFSDETQDASPVTSPVTSPGNSQTRAEELKPPVSDTTPRTISNGSDSATIVADSADQAVLEDTQKPDRGADTVAQDPGPLQPNHDENQRNPTIYDIPHVDLTPVPAQGALHPPSSRPDPFGGKPILPKIMTNAQLESRNSDSPGTAFYTPGGSGEVVDRWPFDSAVNVRVVYSGAGSSSREVIGNRVVDVHQPTDKWKSKYQFPIQPLQLPRRDSKMAGVNSRHGFGISLARPSQNTREHRGDSTFSYSSSPFDEFVKDAGSSTHIPETNTPTIPRRESRSQLRPKLLGGDKGNDAGETMFPRQNGKRAVPGWGGSESKSEETRKEKGKERDDRSRLSRDYVSVPNEVEEHSRDQINTLTPRPSPNTSIIKQLWKKLGVRKPSQLLRSSPPKRPVTQTPNNASAASMITATTESAFAPTVDSGKDRERTLSGISFVNLQHWSATGRKNGNRREVMSPIVGFFEDRMAPFA